MPREQRHDSVVVLPVHAVDDALRHLRDSIQTAFAANQAHGQPVPGDDGWVSLLSSSTKWAAAASCCPAYRAFVLPAELIASCPMYLAHLLAGSVRWRLNRLADDELEACVTRQRRQAPASNDEVRHGEAQLLVRPRLHARHVHEVAQRVHLAQHNDGHQRRALLNGHPYKACTNIPGSGLHSHQASKHSVLPPTDLMGYPGPNESSPGSESRHSEGTCR